MKLIYFLANHPCEDPEILKIIYYIREIMGIAFTVIPIVLIVLITFDFIKSVAAGNEDTMKKNQKIVIKRIVYCLMIFLVMPMVNIAFSAFKTSGNEGLISENGVNYLSCWANADNIASITALTINANFNTDGGNIYGGSSQSCGGTDSCEIILPNATKAGYIFKHWTKKGSSDTYQVGQKVTINRNDQFTAVWEEKPEEEDIITDKDIIDKENEPEQKPDSGNTPSNPGDVTPNDPGGNALNKPTTPITLSSDIETRIKQMIDYAKSLEDYDIYDFNNEVGGDYGGDWCSWFVYSLYKKFEFSYNISFSGDEISYACGWIELEDGAFNGYLRGEVLGDLNYTPQPGDLILFNDPGYCASHVGMVTAVDDNYVYTVEGNTAGYGSSWWQTSKVSTYSHDIPNGDGKFIDDEGGPIIGYYSIRQLISNNQ